MGYTIWPDGKTGEILSLINAERRRQDSRAFSHTCADPISDLEKLPILMEEVGEVANALLQKVALNTVGDRRRDLQKELIQVAAVCTAWAESLLDG